MAANFELKKDAKNEWYWTFHGVNNLIIARSSESYKNRGDCLHSIYLVKTESPASRVYDMTVGVTVVSDVEIK